ncbi:hypothetical protein ACFYPN_22000 [Streptomyces sp. NPDC005576]|uniref:hypothetical protein n=1 Tax=Streptomyces sp. NPDC005576 TaxID=3364726 RepID=UPI0036ACC68D
MNSLPDPVMQLIRAALQPRVQPAPSRADDPVCRVVLAAAKADMKAGGTDHLMRLSAGAGCAASGLTFWLSKERETDLEMLISQLRSVLPDGVPERDAVKMIETMLTGPPGVQQTAAFLYRMFTDDEERFYDLIVGLGRYCAECVGTLSTFGISSEEDTLDDLNDMLQAFYTG